MPEMKRKHDAGPWAPPKAVVLESCEFPIVEGEVDGYKVLELPRELRRLVLEGGAGIIRINSLEIARLLPDYGGRASGSRHSLFLHMDHSHPATDARRYLVLSKDTNGARGGSTLVAARQALEAFVAIGEAYLNDSGWRRMIGSERNYEKRFGPFLSEAAYHRCLDEEDGYERVVAGEYGRETNRGRELAVRAKILRYLICGPTADVVMEEILRKHRESFYEERWERGGVLILDNLRVSHGRYGGNNPPLQRNYCI